MKRGGKKAPLFNNNFNAALLVFQWGFLFTEEIGKQLGRNENQLINSEFLKGAMRIEK